MMATYQDSTKRWRYRFQEKQADGTTLKLSGCAKVNTKLATQEAERKAVAEARKPKGQASKAAPTFAEYVPTFMATWATRNKPSERASKESILRVHLLPAFGTKPLDQISTLDVTEFVAKLLGPEKARLRSPKRVNNILNVLSKIMKEAQEAELVVKLPKIRMLKTGTGKIEFYTFEEFERLVAAADVEPDYRAAILVGGEAGLRAGEIAALRWEDVDFKAKVITVCRTDWAGIEGTPKGTDLRHVPMTTRLTDALKGIRHLRSPRVFCHGDGSAWTSSTMRCLKRSQQRAGFAGPALWHKLRHTFCSHLAMRGAAAIEIKELAGHKTQQVTERYMHLAPGRTRSAIALLEARG